MRTYMHVTKWLKACGVSYKEELTRCRGSATVTFHTAGEHGAEKT